MTRDVRRLDDLVAYLGRDTAAEMMRKAIDGLGRNMTDLRAAADPTVIRRLAHTIKGLAAMYGLNELAEGAAAIEAANGPAVGDRVAALDGLVTDAVRDLTTFMSGLSAAT